MEPLTVSKGLVQILTEAIDGFRLRYEIGPRPVACNMASKLADKFFYGRKEQNIAIEIAKRLYCVLARKVTHYKPAQITIQLILFGQDAHMNIVFIKIFGG